MRNTLLLASVISIVYLSFVDISANDFYAYYTRTGYEDSISDKHADIIVSYGEKGRIVFSRESSYLPRWESSYNSFYFDEVVKRTGDGSDLQPDKYNRHSYVRLIENTSEKIVIHWRYYPHILKTKMIDVVHEFFTFFPNGRVIREIKIGTEKIDHWKDPKYILNYELQLKKDGIEELTIKKSQLSKKKKNPIAGSPLKDNNVAELVSYWTFDEGLDDDVDFVKELVSGIELPIEGHKSYWTKGISGTALKFDGYYSEIKFPTQYAPRISGEFTIEAWISMAAHPFGWVPIIQQSHWKEAGYYFGVNAHGQIGFLTNINREWIELITGAKIENYKWTYVAVSFSDESRKLIIYVDGELKAEMDLEIENDYDALIHANAPLTIGLNSDPLIPLPRERFSYGQYPCITGFEGAIDEIHIYNEELSSNDINKSYHNLKPDEISSEQLFEKRILPGYLGIADNFGAEYKTFTYHDLWDNCWRTSDYDDILVKFDELPVSVTFWRGPSYGAGWVTEKNYWMIDQSVETGNAISYVEHMSDKQGRYTHTRLIENTNARVVIHWRYSSNDVLYSFNENYGEAGIWVDEYMTIYPDGVGIRKVKQKAASWTEDPPSRISWQDVQFTAQPGMTPDDVMNLEAVHLANLKGETAAMDWSNGVPTENPLPSANIELINFKSDYKVFIAFQEGTFINPWGRVPDNMYCHFMTWNHWPVAFITSQGKSSLFPDRITHSALCAADNAVDHGNMAMYGFTNQSVESLIPLVKSWNNPPKLTEVNGAVSLGYDKDQRAYVLNSPSENITFNINASSNEPFVNNGIVIKQWGDRGEVSCLINGKELQKEKELRQGVFYDTEGVKSLVLFIKKNYQNPVDVQINTNNNKEIEK
jgi:hypothetical protein